MYTPTGTVTPLIVCGVVTTVKGIVVCAVVAHAVPVQYLVTGAATTLVSTQMYPRYRFVVGAVADEKAGGAIQNLSA